MTFRLKILEVYRNISGAKSLLHRELMNISTVPVDKYWKEASCSCGERAVLEFSSVTKRLKLAVNRRCGFLANVVLSTAKRNSKK